MFEFERIKDVLLDYRSGTLLINGKRVDIPVKVIIKESDGWNEAKIFNSTARNMSPFWFIGISLQETQKRQSQPYLRL